MSSIVAPGFKSFELIDSLDKSFNGYSTEEKSKLMKQVNGVFQFNIKNKQGEEQVFTIDVKKEGKAMRGKSSTKADAILSIKDKDFIDLATGKPNGQKVYMSGKLKIKGNIMLAMKLNIVFQSIRPNVAKL
ncbi:Oleate-induced peroxisomal protein POX18 [Choanephora cucurbitarum]|uniref:Oleate-induced peroxisomal protein POX18 n=1 Tax=Choanephora cucurbitarum TaxID=101091 RepID=A0A1C7NC71_9FUNG|nr:Oleate-induced peroxisomal protein POX18 [Choanephora cucurbitarum]